MTGWVLPPVQQQFLSSFSKIFFDMANGHNNLKKKQEDRAGPSSDHTRSRTHGFVKGQHNERRTGGGVVEIVTKLDLHLSLVVHF